MNVSKIHICTECLFTGEPSLSFGRLFVEFIANLLVGTCGAPLFQKVRHCPECGSHSMVLITSEAGQIALTKHKEIGEEPPKQMDMDQFHKSSKADDEYMRIRLQR